MCAIARRNTRTLSAATKTMPPKLTQPNPSRTKSVTSKSNIRTCIAVETFRAVRTPSRFGSENRCFEGPAGQSGRPSESTEPDRAGGSRVEPQEMP